MELEKMPNKKFIYECLNQLIQNHSFGSSEINILTNGEECARLFRCSSGFPVLMEIPINAGETEINAVCYDGTKRQRYYKDVFHYNGRAFVVSNHWYGSGKSMPDNRTPFMYWVLSR